MAKGIIPRYVKLFKNFFVEAEANEKMYDTNQPFPSHLLNCQDITWDRLYNHYQRIACNYFQPVTEEEWNSQFEVCDE